VPQSHEPGAEAEVDFGAVLGRVRYDNLGPAVVRVLRGRDRAESERFIALRSHYRFDSFFCAPGKGGAHEKGGVEGEIGRFRRPHLVPVATVGSLAALNQLIAAADILDDGRGSASRSMSRSIRWTRTSRPAAKKTEGRLSRSR
jgi:hypothetical protein